MNRKPRLALLHYYGITKAAANHDPLALDSAGFAKSKWLEQHIKNDSLSTLIQQDNQLCLDIKELTSDARSLIYNNYNLFIQASDTLQAHTGTIDALLKQTSDFEAAFKETSTLIRSAESKHETRRREIRELKKQQTILQKVNKPLHMRKSSSNSFWTCQHSYSKPFTVRTGLHVWTCTFSRLRCFISINMSRASVGSNKRRMPCWCVWRRS
jgi:hypothetical protein